MNEWMKTDGLIEAVNILKTSSRVSVCVLMESVLLLCAVFLWHFLGYFQKFLNINFKISYV